MWSDWSELATRSVLLEEKKKNLQLAAASCLLGLGVACDHEEASKAPWIQ